MDKKNSEVKKLAREDLDAFFRTKGLQVEIGGCGCCGSPWVKITDTMTNEVLFEGDDAVVP